MTDGIDADAAAGTWSALVRQAMKRLTPSQIEFIRAQPVFFVATAAREGKVNVSPKGTDSLRVLDPRRVVWLNLTGSGNETAAHVAASGRMTLMFMLSTSPLIVRVYGRARVVHPRDTEWNELLRLFPPMAGSRQIFDLAVDAASVSCGSGVPIMTVEAIRAAEELEPFYAEMSDEQLHDYWSRKNVTSIDGLPTGIFEDGA